MQTLVIDKSISDCIQKASQYQGVSRIGVFGSFARAEQSDESDIDILYDYYYVDNNDNGISDTFEFLDVLENDLRRFLGNKKIDFVSYHAVVDSDDTTTKQNILDGVVWVYVKT